MGQIRVNLHCKFVCIMVLINTHVGFDFDEHENVDNNVWRNEFIFCFDINTVGYSNIKR